MDLLLPVHENSRLIENYAIRDAIAIDHHHYGMFEDNMRPLYMKKDVDYMKLRQMKVYLSHSLFPN